MPWCRRRIVPRGVATISIPSFLIMVGTAAITGDGGMMIHAKRGGMDFDFGNPKPAFDSRTSGTRCFSLNTTAALIGLVHISATVRDAVTPTTSLDEFSHSQNVALAEFLLPKVFFGPQAGTVSITGDVNSPGAEIILSSSNSNLVHMPPAAIIPTRSKSVSVPLEFLPSTTTEDVTLTAAYASSSVAVKAHIIPWPPLTIMANWSIKFPACGRRSIRVTVFINTLAPAGAFVSLSSNPSVFPHEVVTIGPGSYWATVTVPISPPRFAKSVTITAIYNGTSASAPMLLPYTPGKSCPN